MVHPSVAAPEVASAAAVAALLPHRCSFCCSIEFPWKRLWISCMIVNSTYSFYWDVEQDWDMPWIMQPGKFRQ